jgi:putative transposase
MVFHVLNRANARTRIFAKDADYAAFERVMRETLASKPTRILGYLTRKIGDGRACGVGGTRK